MPKLAVSDALLLQVLLQGHVLGEEGRLAQEQKLAVSDSYAAASEAGNSKTCILGFPMQQGVKQQESIWCCFTCCFIINPRLQVHAASLAAAYIIQDRKFLLFRQPALCDFEEVLAAAEHPRVQVAGDYFLA